MKSLTKIKVIGVGGSGSNALSRIKKADIKDVELIAVNTDAQDLNKAKADLKIRIGKKLTQGLGAGMNPEIGRKSAEENKEEILSALTGADLIFITGGLGGGTGSGASSVIAELAKGTGALTIAVVTKPFSFEGLQRKKIADNAEMLLRQKVDTLITIKNDKLLTTLDSKTTVSNAFWSCDDILRQAVQGITDLILLPGIINVDFADVKTIMANSGNAVLGTGVAEGENRAQTAVRAALHSPLLDISPKGAKSVLFNVSGQDISLVEIEEAGKYVSQEVNSQAKVIFGAVEDKRLKKGQIKITVIATGF